MAPDDATMTLGEALKAQIARRGLSHAEAGAALGVSQAAFTRWANDQSIPHREYVPALAQFLGVSQAEVRAMRARASKGSRVEERLSRIEDQLSDLRKAIRRLGER